MNYEPYLSFMSVVLYIYIEVTWISPPSPIHDNCFAIANMLMRFKAMHFSDRGNFRSIVELQNLTQGESGEGKLPKK